MPSVDDALSYHELGWSVIPVKPDKRPYIQWAKFQQAPAGEDEIRRWWAQWPTANIAVVTGQVSGLVAIDIDSAVGSEAYKINFGEIHNTIKQTTGKPGAMHLLFRAPPGVRLGNSTRALPDVDVRGDGGYILIDPSIHPSGRQYTWAIDPREALDDLMDLPREVQEWFWPAAREDQATKKERLDVQTLLLGVKDGQRNDACVRLAGYYLRLTRGDVEQTKLILNHWDERNEPPLGHKVIETTVMSIHKRQGVDELSSTVANGLITKIEHLVYLDRRQDKYRVYVGEEYVLIEPDKICSQLGFIRSILPLTDHIPPTIPKDEWKDLINRSLQEAQKIVITAEDTTAGIVVSVLTAKSPGIMTQDAPGFEDIFMTHLKEGGLVLIGDFIYFTSTGVQQFLENRGDKIERQTIFNDLVAIGAAKNGWPLPGGKRCKCWRINQDRLTKIVNGEID